MSMERIYEIPSSQADRIVNELRWLRIRYVDAQMEDARASRFQPEEMSQAQRDDVVIQARIAWDRDYPALAELRRKTLRGAS